MTTLAPPSADSHAFHRADPSRSKSFSLLARLERGYGVLRVLSIDVALAALGGGVMAVRITGGRPRPAFYLLLPLAVWVVYTLDHVLDATRMGARAATPRHRFHLRYARPLLAAAIGVGAICAVVGITCLSGATLACGAAVAGLFALHELIVKLAGSRVSPLLVKELGVAGIFTAGTWGVPLCAAWVAGQHPGAGAAVAAAQYLLLAIANLVIFSLFEIESDARSGQSSFVQGIGRAWARRMALATIAAAVLLSPAALLLDRHIQIRWAEGIDLAMAVGLWVIVAFPRTLGRCERYRSLGDGVFLLPLLMVLVRGAGR